MTHATAIIGAGYGDEGKGLATDHVATPDTLVVRFNGGAQAGHTVEMRDGRRHVFSHFGSGAFAGAATWLSPFFVCHPMLFHRERQRLVEMRVNPRLSADPRCPVTTPWDVLINQHLEAARGARRHGSCGVGFGETLERQAHPKFALSVDDLHDHARLLDRLEQIREVWVPRRLAELGLAASDPYLLSDTILERFADDAEAFLRAIDVRDARAVARGRTLVFEGAQGLELDMDRGAFPHVTRSSTGLTNIVALAPALRVTRLHVRYVTRTYVTRHGAGPLAHELGCKPWAAVSDPTNIGNAWQGALRFAWLDVDRLGETVLADRAQAGHLKTSASLLVTCMDQTDAAVRYVRHGRVRRAQPEVLVEAARQAIDAEQVLTSHGPTRRNVYTHAGRARHSA